MCSLLALCGEARAQRGLGVTCQDAACWPAGTARPAAAEGTLFVWAGRPQSAGGRLRGELRLHPAPGLDAAPCAARLSLGAPAGGTLRALGAPTSVTGAVARWDFDEPTAGLPAVVEVGAYARCPGWVEWFAPMDLVALSPERALQSVCALPAVAGGAATIALEAGAGALVLGPRAPVVLRRRGRSLLDACTQRVLLEVDQLGLEVAEVRVPALGEGPTEDELRLAFDPRTAAGWRGRRDRFELRLARPLEASQLRRVRAFLGAARELEHVYAQGPRRRDVVDP